VWTKKGGKRRINGEKNGGLNGELIYSPFIISLAEVTLNGELTAN